MAKKYSILCVCVRTFELQSEWQNKAARRTSAQGCKSKLQKKKTVAPSRKDLYRMLSLILVQEHTDIAFTPPKVPLWIVVTMSISIP